MKMSRLKQKLFGGLAGILLGVTTIIPSKAQERVAIDLSSHPNDTTKNYYGSGDINKDNVITWEDASRLDSLIKETFSDPLDDRLLDRADINGDNQRTLQDKQTLDSLINKQINYLPSNWNKLDSLEKTNWFEKMAIIDQTDTIALGSLCYELSVPFTINFHGFESLANGVGDDFPWKFSKNNRFNIPVYAVSTTASSGNPHAINGVLIGDNPFDFNDWYFIEPRNDNRVNPGDISMALNNDVEINYFWEIDSIDGAGSSSKIIRWDLDGNAKLIEAEPYVIPSNPNKDTISPEISLSISDSSYFNSNVNLEYLVKENQTFLDSAYYELNGIKTNIECSVPYYSGFIGTDSISGTISLSQEGEYDFTLYANDMAKPQGNESILNRYFVIDKTAPTTSDNVPTGWQNSNFNVALTPSDALSGVVSTKYCISSTDDCTPDTEYSGPVPISEEGKQYIRYFSKDSAGNNQSIVSKEVKLDKTLPTTSDNVPTGWQNSNFNVALTPSDALSGIASTKYCISSTDDCTPDTEYSGPVPISEEGKQYIRYFSTDSAGNNKPVVSKEVKLDKTASEIIASINKIEKTDSAEIAINVLEANPNYARYSYNDSDWVYFSSDTLFKEQLKQGENILNVESEDKATNFSEKEVNYNFIPDAVEEPIQNSSLKIYGNPITDYSEIGYSVSKKGKVMLEVYNIQGKKLETLVNEVKVPGNYRSKIDGSEYASGIYFYRLTTPKGTETKKALKK